MFRFTSNMWYATVSSLCLLLMTMSYGFGEKIEFSEQFSNVNYADPDSKGHRYCAYWQLKDGTLLHSTCDPFSMVRCGKPVNFGYKCCSGFEEGHETYSFKGCSRIVSPYGSCVETVLQSPKIAAIAPRLYSVGELDESTEPYTIFAPISEDGFPPEPSSLEPTHHIVKGRFYADDLRDGMQLQTLDGTRKLYVSRYSYGVTAVDCVELVDADLECKSGLIHRVRKSLINPPPLQNTERSSVLKVLEAHPETSQFIKDVPVDLRAELDDVKSGKRFTVLAPRNQAWEAVKRSFSDAKVKQIAASHIIPRQVCSAEMIRSSNVQSAVDGSRIDVLCDIDERQNERRQVISPCGEKHMLVETDITAENGVVHLIDRPIIPLFAYKIEYLKENVECAERLRIKEFVKLLKECDLYMQENEDYTIILPQDEAFTWWANYEQFQKEYQRFLVDQEYRCRVARYHIVKNDGRLTNLSNFASHTQGHRTNNRKNYLYETTYFKRTPQGSELNFHYSPIPNLNSLQMDGASIYLTPRINVIPEENITDILARLPETNFTNHKTLEVNMNEKHFMKNAPRNLYLATTDDGWKDPRAKPNSARPFRPELTMYNEEGLEKFLLLHHVPLYLWGGDIGYFPKNSVHKFNSSVGLELTFWMDESGTMRIGYEGLPIEEWPRVVRWNIPARDGIVWLLDGIIKCPDTFCPLMVEDIDYYDIYVAACQTAHLPDEPDAADKFHEKPTDVANRHPDQCTTILQHSERSVKLIEVK